MTDMEKVINDLQDAVNDDWMWQHADYYAKAMENAIALLKEQDAKTGHWIEKTDYMSDTYYDCSVCDESWTTIDGTPWQNGMNYCPHCGAKMET